MSEIPLGDASPRGSFAGEVVMLIRFPSVILSLIVGASAGIYTEPARSGDFLNPAPAQLDGQFRNTRLSMELQRRQLSQSSAAMGVSGSNGGSVSYDEYQQSGAYQNVIWVPLENIGEGASINVTIGDTQQSADGSTTGASNEVAEGNSISGSCTSSGILNASNCGAD